METSDNNNFLFYKYSEKTIKNKNFDFWEMICNHSSLPITFKEKFYLYENNIEIPPICYCGNNLKFVDMHYGYRKYCSKKCTKDSDLMKEKRRCTNLEKYGVDNPSKSTIFKDKVKKTNLEKFGVEYPLKSECVKENLKEYFLEKYGVDNPSKIDGVRNKAENTMEERYGVRHAMHSNEIKEKLKEYFLEKYGVDNPWKIDGVRNKVGNTMEERYGVRHALQSEEFKEKSRQTNIERYGVDNPSKSKYILAKIQNTMFKKYGTYCNFLRTENKEAIIKKYGLNFQKTDAYIERFKNTIFNKNKEIVNDEIYSLVETSSTEYELNCNICSKNFIIQRQLWRNRKKNNDVICLNCNPISNSISKQEKILLKYIRSIYDGEIIENYRFYKKEIDVYLPEFKIGFEYNGLYWHSELNKPRKYHYDKYKLFDDVGIKLIQIWEDDWKNNNDIIKSMINNRINKSNRIFARKCVIKEVFNNEEVRNFLNKNHIQGFVGSKIKIGLYHNDELVSLMTFGNLRRSLGQKSLDGNYELLRFCNKLNTTVVGGASKIFNYFIKKYDFINIISYSLNNHSNGGLYEKIGFSLLGETDVNYYWCKNGVKYHRYNFRKDKLVKMGYDKNKTEVEIMNENGYFRLFDCGSKKWIFKKLNDTQ
jgi:hypothetical protein